MNNFILDKDVIISEINDLFDNRFNELKRILENNISDTNILSRIEASKFLGISLKTLSNYMDEGLIKAKKVKGRVFLFKKDLQEFVNENPR